MSVSVRCSGSAGAHFLGPGDTDATFRPNATPVHIVEELDRRAHSRVGPTPDVPRDFPDAGSRDKMIELLGRPVLTGGA